MVKFRKFLLAVLIIAVAFSAVITDAWQQLNRPLRLAAPVTVELTPGQRLGSLLHEMEQSGLLADARQRLYLLAYARMRGDAGTIKAGEYAVEPGLTPLGFLRLLVSGKTVLHEIRLIE